MIEIAKPHTPPRPPLFFTAGCTDGLPFARYTIDYGALKQAAAAGNKLVANTF